MHRFPRLLPRALAAIVIVSLVSGCGTVSRSSSGIVAGAPAATQAPISVIGATSPDLRVVLTRAVRDANTARWYEWASHLPPPVPIVSHHPRRPAPVVVDGDRFDRLASCESGQNPTNLSPGGKYRGAFQFSLATWHASGMSGDPIDYSYGDQKAAAESWATRSNPSGQWPVCWARSA